ncbi:taurine dioxygenase [Enhydrobacter aerosaccus]|uniref:Taurine dioxygenase n=1 Tax=Enhydrobacter aerosaccus TaxID=225324 RepID=A0A1T4QBD1_9HYPH|nr:TauD/TfdA family dioxygenase [Enhydrobacter aerosaccus]SKA01100.1 taurine dioxygenase [Enhydrobacter aerosaccus]
MAYETIQIRKLTPAIGAEVSGIDLGGPLSNRQVSDLHDALMTHQTLFFRDQQMTVEQHKALGRLFGELLVHPAAKAELEGHPEIRVVHADDKTETATGEVWHSDMSCEPEPPMGSILYMHETPETGGDTAFANMYLAYETLSEPIKRLCEGLTALHTSAHVYSRNAYGRADKKFPEAVHPVVRTHPETGRKSLFVNRGFTTRIVELRKAESDALLEMLLRHAETPEFQCRFRWQRHSVAFWDNRCALHRAIFDYHPHVRHAHRVTIRGDKPR